MKDLKRVEAKSRAELRAWLKRNHRQTESIWLVTFKKSRPESYLEYDAIVEEALCFGWIDSLPRALDADRTMLRLSPRRARSGWSAANRRRVARLIAEKKMAPAGLAAVARAKTDGSWQLLQQAESPNLPSDLKAAFRRHRGSAAIFAAFPPSSRRAILEWILSAKTAETRAKRLEETARLAAQNIRANHGRKPRSAKPLASAARPPRAIRANKQTKRKG